jgi:hypothetical protein
MFIQTPSNALPTGRANQLPFIITQLVDQNMKEEAIMELSLSRPREKNLPLLPITMGKH